MARISGVDIPNDKHICIALTALFGVGRSTADKLLDELSIKKDLKTKDLSEEELVKIREYIEANCSIEGDLRREVSQNIKRLIEINSYRGIRHKRGPSRQGTADSYQCQDQERQKEKCRHKKKGSNIN